MDIHDAELDEYIFNKNSENNTELTAETSSANTVIASSTSNSIDVLDEKKTIAKFKQATLSNITSQVSAGNIAVDEGLKQFVHAISIINAAENPEVGKELEKNATKEMRNYSKANTFKDETSKIEKRTMRNEAFYKAFRPVLEFDLSHLVGKKQKKIVTKDALTGKKVVSYEDIPDEPAKTYIDRSYGLSIMMLMIVLLIVPYCIANVLLAIFNAVNALFECFNKFGLIACTICRSIAVISIICLILYVILLIIQTAFGIQIFA